MHIVLLLTFISYFSSQVFSKFENCTKNRCVINKNELKFFLLGDWGGLPVWPYYTSTQKKVAGTMGEMSYEEKTDFQIALGDNFYLIGVKDEYDSRFQKTFEKIYTHPSLLRTPWYILAGNHDHNGNITAQLAYSKRSPRWVFPDLFYKIQYELADGTKMDIIMIDTVILCGQTRDGVFKNTLQFLFASAKHPDGPSNKTLAEHWWGWIEEQLQASKANYLFITGHYQVYSTGYDGPISCLAERINPLMRKYSVTAYLCGHDHNLQHLQIKEDGAILNYVLSGAGMGTDVPDRNLDAVPMGSSKYFYPKSSTWLRYLNNVGLKSEGGFILARLDGKEVNFTFYTGQKENLYSFSILPRRIH